uniref:helix-turn-helix domain-containing protein n=1 Tax=Nocardiopsis metallicus TaxID=179819 RepID=UPI0034372E4A
MGTRRTLTLEDREEIALAHTRGEGVRSIARALDRNPSVVSREIDRNTSKRGYRATTAHQRARTRRSRPQQRRIDTDAIVRERVLADLGRGRTPRQIAGRLKLEAENASVEPRIRWPMPWAWQCWRTWCGSGHDRPGHRWFRASGGSRWPERCAYRMLGGTRIRLPGTSVGRRPFAGMGSGLGTLRGADGSAVRDQEAYSQAP